MVLPAKAASTHNSKTTNRSKNCIFIFKFQLLDYIQILVMRNTCFECLQLFRILSPFTVIRVLASARYLFQLYMTAHSTNSPLAIELNPALLKF